MLISPEFRGLITAKQKIETVKSGKASVAATILYCAVQLNAFVQFSFRLSLATTLYFLVYSKVIGNR